MLRDPQRWPAHLGVAGRLGAWVRRVTRMAGMVRVARVARVAGRLAGCVPGRRVRGRCGRLALRVTDVRAGRLGSTMRCRRAVGLHLRSPARRGGQVAESHRLLAGAAVGLGTGPGVAEATRPWGRGARPGWLPGGRRNVRRRGVQGAVREVLHRGRQHVRVGSAGQGAGRHGSSHREFGGEDGTEHALAPAVCRPARRGGRTGPGMRPGRPVLRLARGRLAPRGGPR